MHRNRDIIKCTREGKNVLNWNEKKKKKPVCKTHASNPAVKYRVGLLEPEKQQKLKQNQETEVQSVV